MSRFSARGSDPYADEPLGELAPDRVSTVAADDGTPLAVQEILPADGGEPEITLIGVHGFALSSSTWYFQRRDLAALRLPRVRQIYYDHRGHGRSGSSTKETGTIDQLAADLHAVLRAMAPDGPVVLAGHSMGGMTIIGLAEQAPELFAERVPAVCLITTAAGEVGRTGVARSVLARYSPISRMSGLVTWQPRLVELLRTAGGRITRQAVRRLAFGDNRVPESVLRFLLSELDGTPVRELVNFIATLGEHNRYAALRSLENAHVLVIGGEKDRITPMLHSERIVAELPGADLVCIPGAGHMVQLEQPEVVTSHLIDLLQRSAGVGGGDSRRRSRNRTRKRVRGWLR
ncbi:alpha/beta fold hydrolase [Thermocrispum municipale]|uniref:alpha/beta fold hydrolase n=1 Tax=Thermocrispum municipale TaxID=37926 RepID=UPI00042331FD|nr:alpha/beta hydrolase [Thermocrispum municipale]